MKLYHFQPKFWPKYTGHASKNVLVIKLSSILTKTSDSENCFYIAKFYRMSNVFYQVCVLWAARLANIIALAPELLKPFSTSNVHQRDGF